MGTSRVLISPFTLSADTKKADLEKAMKGHVIAESQLVGLYKRK
jgi:phosphatidylethanolamine-binding protein (PEBP) family uncharacterized protein